MKGCQTQPCQDPQILRSEFLAFFQNDIVFFEVVMGLNDIFKGGYGLADFQGSIIDQMTIFHHHDPVSPFGQHAAGGDSCAPALTHDKIGTLAHGHLPAHLDQCRKAFGGAKGVFGLQSVPIHG